MFWDLPPLGTIDVVCNRYLDWEMTSLDLPNGWQLEQKSTKKMGKSWTLLLSTVMNGIPIIHDQFWDHHGFFPKPPNLVTFDAIFLDVHPFSLDLLRFVTPKAAIITPGSTCLGNPFGACTYSDPAQRPAADENGWRQEEHEVLVGAFDQYLQAGNTFNVWDFERH